MSLFISPVKKILGGQTVVVAEPPTSTAFNCIYVIGIVLTILVVALSLASKNYIFGKK